MSDVFTPQLVLDKAINHCTAITGGGFPISLYPSKIQGIIREVNDCYGFRNYSENERAPFPTGSALYFS